MATMVHLQEAGSGAEIQQLDLGLKLLTLSFCSLFYMVTCVKTREQATMRLDDRVSQAVHATVPARP